MRKFRTSDGYVFYMQPDGSLTSDPDPEKADMTYGSLDELKTYNDAEEVFGP